MGTDSKSLLDKLFPVQTSSKTNQEAGKRVHLDELTRPEWDLVIEIQEGLRLLPGVSLTHVKGHQDDSKPYERLSLLAQLNVDADKMAMAFQTKHGYAQPILLMTPHSTHRNPFGPQHKFYHWQERRQNPLDFDKSRPGFKNPNERNITGRTVLFAWSTGKSTETTRSKPIQPDEDIFIN